MISRVTHPSGHVVVVSRGEGLGALWLRAADLAESAQLGGYLALPPGIERGFSAAARRFETPGPALEESR
jgi:quercetin dioxygenase-like cupin family protein